MNIFSTLGRYVAKQYFLNVLFLIFSLLCIVYLFDTVELIRRASKFDDVPLSLVFQMSILKLPEVGQILLPFAVLFSAMYTFWKLTARYELVVVRSFGFSVWQFLTPIVAVAILLGALQVSLINPVGALLVGKFEQLEKVHLKRSNNQIVLFKGGLWLRQPVPNGGYMILHAKKISQPDWTLQNLFVLQFSEDDGFVKRIDAKTANLQNEHLIMRGVSVHQTNAIPVKHKDLSIPTSLTAQEIEDSFASPETMSFWRLPYYIETLEETGFDATRLKVHYQTLLSQPLMFAAMVLLAACVSMRLPRFRGSFSLIALGVFLGFVVFFLSSFLQALGTSGQIPVLMAAWTPASLCFLLGLSVMITLEDG